MMCRNSFLFAVFRLFPRFIKKFVKKITFKQENRKEKQNQMNGEQVEHFSTVTQPKTTYAWKENGNAQFSRPSKGAGNS